VKAELLVESRNAVKPSRESIAVARSSGAALFGAEDVSSGQSLRNMSVAGFSAPLSGEEVA